MNTIKYHLLFGMVKFRRIYLAQPRQQILGLPKGAILFVCNVYV